MRKIIMSLLFCAAVNSAYAETKNTVLTSGFDHVGLTVSNLEASTQFFVETLGWKLRGQDKSYPASFVTDGNMLITLWRATDPEKAVAFDRKNNIGLHHLAISVSSSAALDSLYEQFKKLPNVRIEFAPELAYGGPARHMMIREPGGNRLEFRFSPS